MSEVVKPLKPNCRRTEERLTPFIDEELPPAERGEVEQHLNGCPPCRVSAEEEKGGRTVLRQRAERLRSEPVPPGLRSRCAALAREHGHATAPWWRARLVPAAFTAAVALGTLAVVVMIATQRSDTVLAAQLTTDHDRCFRDVPLSGRGVSAVAEEARLADEYGWDVHIPPSSPQHGVTLVGTRRCLYANGMVPHLLYTANGHEMSLYVLEGVQRAEGDVTTLGHRSRIWSRGPTTFVLVSPADAGDLTQALAYVKQEAH